MTDDDELMLRCFSRAHQLYQADSVLSHEPEQEGW